MNNEPYHLWVLGILRFFFKCVAASLFSRTCLFALD